MADDSPFAAREFIAGKDAMTPATDILTLDQESFSAAFRKSPMKRAKLSGLTRNAVAVLRNVCRRAEPPALEAGTPGDDPPRRDPAV